MVSFIFFHHKVLLLFSSVVTLTIRRLLLKNEIFIFLYYLFSFLIFLIIGGAALSAVDDCNRRLEKFISLEKSGELKIAKENLSNFDDGMFKIDLEAFKDSSEFIEYFEGIKGFSHLLYAIFTGWAFALLVDICISVVVMRKSRINKRHNL